MHRQHDSKARIADWPEDDRPREKLLRLGPDALSDAELLAIILRVGRKDFTAIDLARQILQRCGGFRGIARMDVEMLQQVQGIGTAKAAQIKAALAIGQRLAAQAVEDHGHIANSRDIFERIHLRYRDRKREIFGVVLLTSRNKIMEIRELFQGSVTESLLSIREVIREILNSGAASVVFYHNHPSGEVTPSSDDVYVTRQLLRACRAIDVHVLDHIIVGESTYYSFADAGYLNS